MQRSRLPPRKFADKRPQRDSGRSSLNKRPSPPRSRLPPGKKRPPPRDHRSPPRQRGRDAYADNRRREMPGLMDLGVLKPSYEPRSPFRSSGPERVDLKSIRMTINSGFSRPTESRSYYREVESNGTESRGRRESEVYSPRGAPRTRSGPYDRDPILQERRYPNEGGRDLYSDAVRIEEAQRQMLAMRSAVERREPISRYPMESPRLQTFPERSRGRSPPREYNGRSYDRPREPRGPPLSEDRNRGPPPMRSIMQEERGRGPPMRGSDLEERSRGHNIRPLMLEERRGPPMRGSGGEERSRGPPMRGSGGEERSRGAHLQGDRGRRPQVRHVSEERGRGPPIRNIQEERGRAPEKRRSDGYAERRPPPRAAEDDFVPRNRGYYQSDGGQSMSRGRGRGGGRGRGRTGDISSRSAHLERRGPPSRRQF